MLGTLDDTEELTYAAVGLALSRWEELEVALADLYSLFVGAPTDVAVIQSFCDANCVFIHRLRAFDKAARSYFVHLCDQEIERDLLDIIVAAEAASIERNRIAHGLVQAVEIATQGIDLEAGFERGYLLCPPWYAMKRLRLKPNDGYGSLEIIRLSEDFLKLARRADRVLNAMLQRQSSP